MAALSRKVAWITGAGTGIGREVALELARRGAAVVLSGRRRDKLEQVAAAVAAMGGQSACAPCDVCDEAQLAAAVEVARARFGRLDIVVANAGFSVAGRIEELSAADWRRQLDTNVVGAALTVRHALPALRQTRGRICLVGSVAALIAAPGFGAYHCSKHALRAIGYTLAAELHGSGVSTTLVHPGFVASDIHLVDNQGAVDASRVDRRPQQLMWPTDRAARVVVDALERRKREVVFTGHGKLGAFVGQHLPGVAHFFMTRLGARIAADMGEPAGGAPQGGGGAR